jgi:hypothetical protein
MNEEPPIPGLTGLDLDFIHRTYRTSLILTAIGFPLLWEALSLRAGVGWLVGVLLSLAMLAGVEWTVRRYVRPETSSTRSMLGASAAKMLLAAGVLVLAFIAAQRGWLSLVWVLVGFMLPHVVIVLKLVGRMVNARMRA